MVRMDWQPAPDGLAQILQLLKVRHLLLQFSFLLSCLKWCGTGIVYPGSRSDLSDHSGSDLIKWTSRAAVRLPMTSVPDPLHFGTDPDPCIRIFDLRIRILSSVRSSLIKFRIKHMWINEIKKLWNFQTMFDDKSYIFSKKTFVLKFNFASIIQSAQQLFP